MEESNIKHIMDKLHKLKCSSRWLRGTTCSSNWLSCIMKVSQVEYVIFNLKKKRKLYQRRPHLAVVILTLSKRENIIWCSSFPKSLTLRCLSSFALLKIALGKAVKAVWVASENPFSATWLMAKAADFTIWVSSEVLVLAPFPSAINEGNLC